MTVTTSMRAAIAVSTFLLLLLAFAPGGLSPDSLVQYEQARTGSYTDWHPPLMAALWRGLLLFQEGPLPMLSFHLAMLTGACFLLSAEKNQWWWLALPFLPFVIGISGMIWKDVGFAYALLLAFALYRRKLPWPALPFFLYALLVRSNAIFAIAPLVYFLFRDGRPAWGRARTFAVAFGVSLLLLAATPFVNRMLLGAAKTNPRSVMMFDEIAATSHVVKQNLFAPEFAAATLPWEELPRYQAEKGFTIYDPIRGDTGTLEKNWQAVLRNHPWEYLQAKLSLIGYFAGFPLEKQSAFYWEVEANDFGVTPPASPLRGAIKSWVDGFQWARIFYLPIFWLPFGAWLFRLGVKRKDRSGNEICALTGSGLCYYAGYLLVTPTPDYRFMYWTVLACTAAFLVWRYAPVKSEQ